MPGSPIFEEDYALAGRLRSGDIQAFDTIYIRYARELLRFSARRTGSRSTADDLVQDAFTALWQRRESIASNTNIRAYLYRILHNLLIDRARHSDVVSRESEADPIAASGLSSAAVDPAEAIEHRDFIKALDSLVTSLSEQQRTLLHLRWSQGLGFAEIAEVLGITPAAAQKQASRILISLKDQLRQFG